MLWLWDKGSVPKHRGHPVAEGHKRALAATPEEVRVVTDRARRRWEEEYAPQAGRQRVQRLLEELGV